MKVVVVIVTYNGMKWYRDCFDSLRNSSIALDIIVVDNNSSDETVDFIRNNYPEIFLVENKENLGFGQANNIGFNYAIEKKADYVFLLNQDAWIKPDTICGLVELMQKQPEYGILSPMQINKSEDKLDLPFQYYITPNSCPELLSDSLVKQKYIKDIYPIDFTNAAMWLISLACIKKTGGFEPLFFHYGEDVNYTHRCKYHGFLIGVCPHYFAVHDREEALQKSKSFKKKKKQDYIYYKTQIMNINESLIPMFYRILVLLLSQFIHNLLRFKFTDSFINVCSSLSLIVNIYSINNARNQEKKTGSYLSPNI